MPIADLSHRIADADVTTPGQPGPRIGYWKTHADTRGLYAEGTSFSFSHLDMIGGTGTYLDAPLHRFENGADIASLPLERLVNVPGIVVDAPWQHDVTLAADAVAGLDVRGKAVLIRTGWDARFGTAEYLGGHPYLSTEAADALVDGGAAIVGIDSVNIDSTEGNERPIHTALLAAGIPIVEHLRGLELVPHNGFLFTATPLNFVGLATSPVRAVASW
ncbi:cyclase family protein [Demequina aurantiaca]|uniref:cyclase family protein n=1 Tax=Demequina aurantiaca TaxID=676200 RepID=UPI000781DDFA|nr:cyclase family protein [Demequina aurantiaca]